jgi:hypothetical protein
VTGLALKAVTAVVLAFIGLNLLSSARRMAGSRDLRDRIVWIVRGLRPRHFLLAPVVLTLVLLLATLLVQIPGLDFGWWTFLGGQGNPVFGRTNATSGTPLEWLIPLVFLVLLIPCLPLFAEREERSFRLGAEHWTRRRRLWRSIQFGMVHAVIGIPVGVALALSLGGIYFTWAYLRGYRRASLAAAADVRPYGAIGPVGDGPEEPLPLWPSPPPPSPRELALAESTRTHLGYNLTIVMLVLPALVLSGFVK